MKLDLNVVNQRDISVKGLASPSCFCLSANGRIFLCSPGVKENTVSPSASCLQQYHMGCLIVYLSDRNVFCFPFLPRLVSLWLHIRPLVNPFPTVIEIPRVFTRFGKMQILPFTPQNHHVQNIPHNKYSQIQELTH